MTTPEILRIVLLIAMGVCLYLIMRAWQTDYITTPIEIDNETITQQADSGAEEFVANDVPIGSSSQQNEGTADDFVPDASLVRSNTVGSSVSLVEDQASLVTVKTPLMDVTLDRRGGDVVGVDLVTHPVSLDQPDIPTTLLQRRNGRVYIAQSGLVGRDGFDANGSRPLYATNRSTYSVEPGEQIDVVFTTERDGVTLEKHFLFHGDTHLVDVVQIVENNSTEEFRANVYAQLTRDGGPAEGAKGFLGPRAFVGGATTTLEKRYEKIDFDDLDEGERFREEVPGGWMAILQHYFLSVWIPDSGVSDLYVYYGLRDNRGNYRFGLSGPEQVIQAGGRGEFRLRFYSGPKTQKVLRQIAENLNLTVDYGFLWWLALPLFHVLEFCFNLLGNWGAAIILLTLAVKLALYPLSALSYKSMAKMRTVAPQMTRIKERFGSDRQRLSKEMMALYQKEKVNPMLGCLPMLLQMPVFIALYWVLYESVELRQAPFMLWIQDLSVMDPFFILPILMGLSMFAMQRLNPPMPDPMQQRMMQFMPLIFTVLFVFFPAGLVLYWLMNNLLSFAQQYYTTKKIENAAAAKSSN